MSQTDFEEYRAEFGDNIPAILSYCDFAAALMTMSLIVFFFAGQNRTGHVDGRSYRGGISFGNSCILPANLRLCGRVE